MPTLVFDNQPTEAVQTSLLRSEIGEALSIPTPYVDIRENSLEIVGDVDESMRDQILLVIEAHRPAEPAVTQEERIAALETELRGMKERAAATSVSNSDAAKVRDAITGKA